MPRPPLRKSKRTGTARPPAREPSPATSRETAISDEEQMFEQSARALLEFGDDLGLTDTARRAAIDRALTTFRRQPYRLQEALGFQELLQVSEVLGRWHREPRWLDESSQPLPLPLHGVRSFSTLCEGLLPADRLPRIIEDLLRERILVQDEEGRLSPRRKVAGTPAPHAWMLSRVPAISRAFYSTVAHNCLSVGTGEETRCERGTTVTIPKHMAGEFNRQVKRMAHGLLDQIDDLGHSAPYQAKGETVQAGVEVFAYVESPTRKASP